MAFVRPTFNQLADIYTWATWPGGPPRLTAVPAQWRGVAKITTLLSAGFISTFGIVTEMLLPPGTDVRGILEAPTNNPDTIVIASMGINYAWQVVDVYDVGKGFTNEYRVCALQKHTGWPTPIP